ncbi:MAG TPA: cysteine--tRNA ligase [Steroidobacteraceae bacterium]|nr:cysteine--tRNA ligase [Steroidobacteraceae bacterium]
MIRIHNSLTGEKQELVPLEPGHVRMYSCGVTVYDFFHVGNARMLVVFDMVSRYLRHRRLRVTYVRNITDVDDKIINRAREAGVDWREHAKKFAAAMHEDLDKLGCLRPEKEPKASEYIDEMLAMIGQLIERGYAYQASNGDVMYDVHKFDGYGRLSGKKLEDLRAGARVEVDSAKRDPLDFVLWKSAKPGEPAWPSPWGEGRPGWHIECSAMSVKELGEHFDIHGGGLDLKFPHHENEIAQTCGATGAAFANIWMHNGFLNIDNEKMSKSLGNFFTMREVLAKIKHPEVLRFFLLSSHYRGPMNYSPDQLTHAEAGLNRLYTALRDVAHVGGPGKSDQVYSPTQATVDFEAAMDDDFNTPEAIAVLQGLARELNTARAEKHEHKMRLLAGELRALAGALGFLTLDPEAWFRAGASADGLSDAAIDALIAARGAAKQAKNWPESDRIRKELAEAGVILEDKPGGLTTWRRA